MVIKGLFFIQKRARLYVLEVEYII